jgi:hypothetical protein
VPNHSRDATTGALSDFILEVKEFQAQISSAADAFELVRGLRDDGYTPLLLEARFRFLQTANPDLDFDTMVAELRNLEVEEARRYPPGIEEVSFHGDMFKHPAGPGLLLLRAEPGTDRFIEFEGGIRAEKLPPKIRIAFLGPAEGVAQLESFRMSVERLVSKHQTDLDWKPVVVTNILLRKLRAEGKATFIPGESLLPAETAAATVLTERSIRDFALKLKIAGGLLEGVQHQQDQTARAAESSAIDKLVELGLAERQFVVICKASGNQVNRSKTREAITAVVGSGVQCSCGRELSEEAIEPLVTPTDLLPRMLDQSHWMSLVLLEALAAEGIDPTRVLLNVRQGSNEVDALVDLAGTSLMVELKDDEFSIGHAYPVGGRIALYSPTHTLIASSKSVSTEVREYFESTKPATSMHYVGTLPDLGPSIRNLVRDARSRRATALLEPFSKGLPVTPALFAFIEKELQLAPAVRGRPRSRRLGH